MGKNSRSGRALSGEGWSFGEEESSPSSASENQPLEKQSPRLRWERRKGGGGVTIVDELQLNKETLRELGSGLRNFCSAGGKTLKDGVEIQGDHREKLRGWFRKKGCAKVRG